MPLSRGIDQALPVQKDPKLMQVEQEHLQYLETRMRLLHPGKIGRHYPTMHIPLVPGKSVRMPYVDKKVLETLGLKTSVLSSYDMDYFGASNQEEFDHAKTHGLAKFPGLWFSVLSESGRQTTLRPRESE